MSMLHTLLLVVLGAWPVASSAQFLVMQRPLDLGTAIPGTTVRCETQRCGEVALTRLNASGAFYVAHATPATLRGPSYSLRAQVRVACLPNGTGAACRAGTSSTPIRWGVGAEVVVAAGTPAGLYRGLITILVEGAGWQERQRVPVTLRVEQRTPSCMLTRHGSLRFGRATAHAAGTIVLDPVLGTRHGSLGRRLADASSFSLAYAHITTSTEHVVITVTAPPSLTGRTGHVAFASALAWRPVAGGPLHAALTGSGSLVLKTPPQGALELRLGGRIDVPAYAPAGRYRGTIQMQAHCY